MAGKEKSEDLDEGSFNNEREDELDEFSEVLDDD